MNTVRRALALVVFGILISGCAPTLHVIGVYEGSYPTGVRHSFGYHPDGNIDVHVRAIGRPVILALSSYEPVIWSIKQDEEVVIKEIILSGYHPSKVAGVAPSVRITRQGFGYTYQPNARNSELARKLKEYTGLEIETYQGMYAGQEFSIH
jgi:hypothetical protein